MDMMYNIIKIEFGKKIINTLSNQKTIQDIIIRYPSNINFIMKMTEYFFLILILIHTLS